MSDDRTTQAASANPTNTAGAQGTTSSAGAVNNLNVPQPSTPRPGAAPQPADLADIVEQWYASHIHGSIVGRNTEILNHVRQSVDALKNMLAGR